MPAARPAGSPATVLDAFIRANRWKTWALVAQFGLNCVLVLGLVAMGTRQPDVVLIAPDGASTYVNRSQAGDALVAFLAEQRQRPSDVTVVHFARLFLDRALAINASTIEAAWPEALSMMAPSLRDRVAREAQAAHLVEGYAAAGTKLELSIDSLTVLERHDDRLRLQAKVGRTKSGLSGPAVVGVPERLVVDLVLRVVPRTAAHPDGLEVSDWGVQAQPASPLAPVTP